MIHGIAIYTTMGVLMSTEKGNIGRTAETYWERRTVMLEHVLMNITGILMNDTFNVQIQKDLIDVMTQWDEALAQLDVEFNQ